MVITEGDIVPGVRIGDFLLGVLKEDIIKVIGKNNRTWEIGNGFSIILLENAKMWFDKTQKLYQIGVTKGFKGKYNSIGIGSTMKDICNKFGEYYDEGDEFLIKGIEGICFELEDIENWEEISAPIEWIFVYKK